MASALRKVLVWALLCGYAFAQSPLEQAVVLAQQRRYREADNILQHATAPTDIRQRIAFYRLKAAVAAGLHDNAGAVRDVRAALMLAPENTGLLLATAVAELQDGQLDDALKHATKAGNVPMAQALIGEVQEHRGDHRAAAKAYEAAVALAPEREDYRIALAFQLMQQPDFAPAIAMLQQTAPLFPKSAKLRTLLGIAQYAAGYNNEAIAALSDAIALDPQMDSAYRCLTQIVLQSSAAPSPAVVKALCTWSRVVCSALQLRVARETHNAALTAEAVAGLERAPRNDAIGTCELARAYEWENGAARARHAMERCVRLDPSPQNHYRLGMLYRKLGLTALAHEQMDLRAKATKQMSEQTAAWLKSLQKSSSASRE
jgi:tetratricopeptide (TPR) repeat protein